MSMTLLFTGTGALPATTTLNTTGYDRMSFYCKGVGAAEAIDVKFGCGSSWETLRDATGTAVRFTGSGGTPANVNSFSIDGGPLLQFTGTVAGTVEIWYAHGIGTAA